MKTKVILILAAFFFTNLTFAQINKGNWFVSGNSTLQVSSSKVEGSSSSTTTVFFSPSFGYFVIDGLSVGVSANILNSDGSTVYAFLPTASYYFQTQGSVKPFVEVGIGYGKISVDEESTGGLSFGGGAGITYFINQNVGLNIGLQYLRGDYDGAVNNTFGGAIGFSIFF